jgi:hypothetical protein
MDKEGHFNVAYVPDDGSRINNNGSTSTKEGADDSKLDLGKLEMPATPSTPRMTYGPGEGRRMYKNVVIICIAFMLLFTAFQSMAALQNSLNPTVSFRLKGCIFA